MSRQDVCTERSTTVAGGPPTTIVQTVRRTLFGEGHERRSEAAGQRSTILPQPAAVEAVQKMLRFLSKREEQVLRMRFGIGTRSHSTFEISQRLGMLPQQVRRLEMRALAKLRDASLLDDTPDGPAVHPDYPRERPPWLPEERRTPGDPGRKLNPWDEV